MSTQSSTSSSSGSEFASLLTVAFIVLKLTGVIAWSWWWVLSPLWIGFALGMLILLVGFVGVRAAAPIRRRRARELRRRWDMR